MIRRPSCRAGSGGTPVAIQESERLSRPPVSPGLAGGAGFEVVRAGPSLGRPGPILTETLRLGTS